MSGFKTTDRNSTPVYSTRAGRICPVCGQPSAQCPGHPAEPKPAGDGIVRIRREVSGRRGKTVTVVTGFALEKKEIEALSSTLKRRLGTGGSVKDGNILMQGDYVAALVTWFTEAGYKVKPAGG
ncbi:stress response translation initiation inhibitor YciH [candidate division KSB1 bacterium]|nr:stress response translation initiation inhibitor YciH [candidate division KSB1 bacterium]